MFLGDFVPSMKKAMELVSGLAMGPPRLPLTSLDETSENNLAVKLKMSSNVFEKNNSE